MIDDTEILFYILVPVYKVEKYIRECIESVLNQSYRNFRLILVDDGSPDSSGKICDEYAENDNRIHVIHQRNMGVMAARDTAVQYVQSNCFLQDTYVMFIDSDDTLKLNALERVATVIQQQRCDMVIFGLDRVDGQRVLSHYCDNGEASYVERDKRKLYKKVFSDTGYNNLSRKAVRTELIPVKNYEQYYRFSHGEDLLRSIDLYKAASTVFFCRKVSIIIL